MHFVEHRVPGALEVVVSVSELLALTRSASFPVTDAVLLNGPLVAKATVATIVTVWLAVGPRPPS